MKLKHYIFLGLALTLPMISVSCSKSYEDFEDNYVEKLPQNNDDGLTLHAFCWTFKQIKDNLPGIYESGFKSILTMPLQTPKNGGSTWWSFYQPLSFSIASSSSLGTKEELKELCLEADKYGISIYCDVVFNHMANISDDDLEDDGTPKVSPKVGEYEPYIYEHRNDKGDSSTFHHNKNATGSGAETQYYPYGKLPDLNTGNPYVQERCLSYLKECIDAGIDGFRFDAAKHIETSQDKDYPSNFWENTLLVAKAYYKEKENKELYAYGEVLSNPLERDINLYANMMDVTCDGYIQGVHKGVVSSKSADAICNAQYGKNVDASKVITWVESHDTYVESSTHINETRVAKEWGVIASRKGINALFLARPNANIDVGQIGSYGFESELVASANRFHNRFIGAEEDLHSESDDLVFVNERYSEEDDGAYVLNIDAEKKNYTKTVKFNHLSDGNYYDLVTGSKIVVSSKTATINFDQSGICYLVRSHVLARPSFTISSRGESFADKLNVELKTSNASESFYYFNDDESSKVSFNEKVNITIGDHVINNEEILNFVVKNGDNTKTRRFVFNKITLIDGYFNVINLNPIYFEQYELYIWSWEPSKWHKNYTLENNVLLIDVTGYTGFLLGLFNKDYVIENTQKWDENIIKQSVDIKGEALKKGFYDASGF